MWTAAEGRGGCELEDFMRLATMYWAGRVWVVLGSAATGLRAEEVMRVRADLLLDQRLHVALSARRTLMLLDVPASDVG